MLIAYQKSWAQFMSQGFDQEFETLQKEWYQRLKDHGFEDIEVRKRSQTYLKRAASICHRKWCRGDCHLHHLDGYLALYFDRATSFLYEHEFKDRIEEEIWKMHSDGLSIRESTHILRAIGFTFTKSTVGRTIKRLKGEMFESGKRG